MLGETVGQKVERSGSFMGASHRLGRLTEHYKNHHEKK